MFKRFTSLFVGLAAMASAISCSETTKEETADILVISKENVAFPMGGGTAKIAVASISEWQYSISDPSWVSAENSGESLTLTVPENTSGAERKAKVTLSSATSSKDIEITQSWSGAIPNLTVNAPESIELDSEGESFSFTVESAGEWTVSSSADWLSISKDGNTVSISAPVNAEDHRTAALTVTATAGNDTQAATINVEQQSRNENTYYNMLGYYGLRANDWYINTAAVGEAGIGAFCTIEEKEYRKSFIIKDLFANGTEVSATYDSRSKKMSIDLGALCLTREMSTTLTYYYYLVQMSLSGGKFHSGTLTGTFGTAYNDIAKEQRGAILLSGFADGYSELGLIVMPSNTKQYSMIQDMYYASGEMYLVKCDKTDAE